MWVQSPPVKNDQGDPPATILGLLTGEPKASSLGSSALLHCAFLAAPMLALILLIGALPARPAPPRYQVVPGAKRFVERGGVMIVGVRQAEGCGFVGVTGRASGW